MRYPIVVNDVCPIHSRTLGFIPNTVRKHVLKSIGWNGVQYLDNDLLRQWLLDLMDLVLPTWPVEIVAICPISQWIRVDSSRQPSSWIFPGKTSGFDVQELATVQFFGAPN